LKDVSEAEMLEDIRVSDEKIDEIRQHTATDPKLQKVMQYTMSGWPTKFRSELNEYHKYREEFACCGGLLIKVDRIVVPEALRAKLLDCLYHAHNGVVATLRLARDSLFWPGITNDIKRKVSHCEACRKHDGNPQREPMKSMPIPELPCKHESKNYLVAVNHYSDHFEVDELEDMTTKTIIRCCKKNFARYGAPKILHSDNARNFVNNELKEFAVS
jgi:hypothetical protein